jgi:hypothetical protein
VCSIGYRRTPLERQAGAGITITNSKHKVTMALKAHAAFMRLFQSAALI